MGLTFLGLRGELVSEKASDFMYRNLKKELNALKGPIYCNDMEDCVTNACSKTEVDVLGLGEPSQFSGTTFVAVITYDGYLYTVNIGDSRAFVFADVAGKLYPELETVEHKPSDSSEKERIRTQGGIVRAMRDNRNRPSGPERVWDRNMNGPGLAVSRVFGDCDAHRLGVCSKPGKLVPITPML